MNGGIPYQVLGSILTRHSNIITPEKSAPSPEWCAESIDTYAPSRSAPKHLLWYSDYIIVIHFTCLEKHNVLFCVTILGWVTLLMKLCLNWENVEVFGRLFAWILINELGKAKC